ncbi:MAG: DUF1800 domain-containing protein [Acidisphaera sp.]|nr:DUF1800 domain-containing protein [Acidisphaera sp.]
MDTRTAHALIRFGLGRRGADPLPGDPAAWLHRQLQGPDPANFADLPATPQALSVLREQREAEKRDPNSLGRPRPVQVLFRTDAAAQLANAIDTPAPFRERLVWFWTNHFTVSLRQGGTAAVIGPFIREAIRPHVTGRFADMLLAVMRHPAMLMYLDQAGSVGPDSLAGQRQHRGLNENLARECMELHTVTPAAGYTQADVTAFARVLTGWSIELRTETPGMVFRPNAHEPGTQTVMGHEFPPGEAGGVAALMFLASYPTTHRNLAAKLVRHFVADDPPPDAVRRIEGVLRDSDGDLGAASAALIDLAQAWQPLTKLRSPQDYVIAAIRALALPDELRPDVLGVMGMLGQPLWNAPLPNGWPDRAADWAGPEELLRRADWAFGVSARAADADPVALAEANLGPLLRPATLAAMQHAGSRRDAMTLLLSSPEFMRR